MSLTIQIHETSGLLQSEERAQKESSRLLAEKKTPARLHIPPVAALCSRTTNLRRLALHVCGVLVCAHGLCFKCNAKKETTQQRGSLSKRLRQNLRATKT